ncbi:hypothetical protein ACSS6N_12155 [Peribacillus frigoritolerans]|uniref:hypothetical protein n=1 Tax=Peribacillus frigoritolerans TaxID=450367 RepID=UPI003F87F5A7
MSKSNNQFFTEVYCKNCTEEIIVVGSLNPNLTLTTGAGNTLALNPVEVGSVLTTEGHKKDIKFDIKCPKCDTFENYQSLI